MPIERYFNAGAIGAILSAAIPAAALAYAAPETLDRSAQASPRTLVHYVDRGKICVAASGHCYAADSGRGPGLNNSRFTGHPNESPAPNGPHPLTRYYGSRWTAYGPVWLLGNTPGRTLVELHGPVPLKTGEAGSLGCIKVKNRYADLVKEMADYNVDTIITIPGGGVSVAYAEIPAPAAAPSDRAITRLTRHWNGERHAHRHGQSSHRVAQGVTLSFG